MAHFRYKHNLSHASRPHTTEVSNTDFDFTKLPKEIEFTPSFPFQYLVEHFYEKIPLISKHVEKQRLLNQLWTKFGSRTDTFTLMRLLLPGSDNRGAYHIKEAGLAKFYADTLQLPNNHKDAILHWKDVKYVQKIPNAVAGDFGALVECITQNRVQSSSTLSIEEIQFFLDKLAIAPGNTERYMVLNILLCQRATAKQNKWLCRIILQDLKLGITEKSILNHYHPDANALYGVDPDLEIVCKKCINPKKRLFEKGSARQDALDMIQGQEISSSSTYTQIGSKFRIDPNAHPSVQQKQRLAAHLNLDLHPRNVQSLGVPEKSVDSARERALKLGSSISVGIPFVPMSASAMSSLQQPWLDRPVGESEYIIQLKYDGHRVVIHKNGSDIQLFTRNRNNVTKEYHTIIPFLRTAIKAKVVILDSEIVPISATGSKEHVPFSDLKPVSTMEKEYLKAHPEIYQECFENYNNIHETKIKRDYTEQSQLEKYFAVFIFDIVYVSAKAGGLTPLIHKPLRERLSILTKCFSKQFAAVCSKRIFIAPSKRVSNPDQLNIALNEAISNHDEGLMLKDPEAPYEISKRSKKWLKLKPDYIQGKALECDCVVIGGYWGSGERRSGKFSTFLVGVPAEGITVGLDDEGDDKEPPEYWSFAKVPSFKQSELEDLHLKFGRFFKKFDKTNPPSWLKLATSDSGVQYECPDVYIDPRKSFCLQLRFSQLISTHKFRTGICPRFIRCDEIRFDKPWFECATTANIASLFHMGSGVNEYDANDSGYGMSTGKNAVGGGSGSRSKRKVAKMSFKSSNKRFQWETAPDLSGVKQVSDILAGFRYLVRVSSESKISKQELEQGIYSLGGTITQGSNCDVIITDDIQCSQAINETRSKKYDVIKADIMKRWIDEKKIEYTPEAYHFATKSTLVELAQRFDFFGNPWSTKLTLSTMKKSLQSVFNTQRKSLAFTTLDIQHAHRYIPLNKAPFFHEMGSWYMKTTQNYSIYGSKLPVFKNPVFNHLLFNWVFKDMSLRLTSSLNSNSILPKGNKDVPNSKWKSLVVEFDPLIYGQPFIPLYLSKSVFIQKNIKTNNSVNITGSKSSRGSKSSSAAAVVQLGKKRNTKRQNKSTQNLSIRSKRPRENDGFSESESDEDDIDLHNHKPINWEEEEENDNEKVPPISNPTIPSAFEALELLESLYIHNSFTQCSPFDSLIHDYDSLFSRDRESVTKIDPNHSVIFQLPFGEIASLADLAWLFYSLQTFVFLMDPDDPNFLSLGQISNQIQNDPFLAYLLIRQYFQRWANDIVSNDDIMNRSDGYPDSASFESFPNAQHLEFSPGSTLSDDISSEYNDSQSYLKDSVDIDESVVESVSRASNQNENQTMYGLCNPSVPRCGIFVWNRCTGAVYYFISPLRPDQITGSNEMGEEMIKIHALYDILKLRIRFYCGSLTNSPLDTRITHLVYSNLPNSLDIACKLRSDLQTAKLKFDFLSIHKYPQIQIIHATNLKNRLEIPTVYESSQSPYSDAIQGLKGRR